MKEQTSAPRVLCIEDDPEMIELVCLILEQHGYEVVGRTSGSQGLRAAAEIRPDVILLDLMMPEMDGWEVYRHIKREPSLAAIPVIIVTAKAQNIDKVLGLHIAKVDDYVTKPFGPNELLRCIERVLARHERKMVG
ncbi:MAG: response regulator transcription factor [Anaerolineae bacterium]